MARRRFPSSFDDFYGLILVLALAVFLIYVIFPSVRYQANEFVYKIARKMYTKNVDGTNYIPRGFEIVGIDVSHHQGLIFWDEVKTATIGDKYVDFAFIKATEGKTFKDRHFKRNWKQASSNEIIRGAYHYYKPNVNSTHQANHYIRRVDLKKGDLPPVLDIEEKGKYGIDNTKEGMLNWLKLVQKHYGVKPIIYTNPNYYSIYFEGDKDFKDYPIWIAHYYTYKPRFNSKKYKFWQYTDKGKLDGINHRVDLNVFNGSFEKFQSLLID